MLVNLTDASYINIGTYKQFIGKHQKIQGGPHTPLALSSVPRGFLMFFLSQFETISQINTNTKCFSLTEVSDLIGFSSCFKEGIHRNTHTHTKCEAARRASGPAVAISL